MGNVVVYAVVRTLTRKAVGKAMKSAKTTGGKRKKPGRRRRVRRRASEEALGELVGSREARRIKSWIPIEANAKRSYAGNPRSVPRVDAAGYAADGTLGEPRVRRADVSHDGVNLEEARIEEGVRRGARRALDEKEQEQSGGGGLYGSQIDQSHIIGAAIAELVGTFILVFVVMAVATDERAPAAIAPIAVGFALAVGVFIAGPVTGGSVNPARSLGPMLVAGDLTSVWLYILGPIVGGALGALLYDRTMAQTQGPA